MEAAGLPASLAPFSAMSAPSTIGSYGLGEAASYGAAPFTMGDRFGMMAKRMMDPQALMMNGMKMAGQGLLGGQQQQFPNHAPSMQMQPYQPVQVPQTLDEARRKRRDELLRQMLGGR